MRHHNTEQSARESFIEFLTTAWDSGKWMMVACHVDKDGNVHVGKTTYDFPTNMIPKSLAKISEIILEQPCNDPLPVAQNIIDQIKERRSDNEKANCVDISEEGSVGCSHSETDERATAIGTETGDISSVDSENGESTQRSDDESEERDQSGGWTE